MPRMHVRFYPYTGVNNTIRLRDGELHIRLSDALEGAPHSVLHAIAHVLLAKLYRKPISAAHSARFRQYVSSEKVSRHVERMRQQRGRKILSGAKGRTWDLDEVFDALNARFFHGLMAKPTLTWSMHHGKRLLGHYDAAHNTIVVSKVFDRPATPRFAIEYLLYHEMLHLKHPVKLRGTRRCVHPRAFQEDEKRFPQLAEAKAYLKTL